MYIPELDKSLDWEVEVTPVHDQYGDIIPGYKYLANNKTGKPLNICKNSYQPVYNHQLMESAELLSEKTGLQIEGYASFKNGQKVLAYLRNIDTVSIGGYPSDDFMIIGNSHNYSTSFFTGLTNRVHRCSNMFTRANQQNRISHTSNNEKRITDLIEAHTLYFNEKTGIYEEMNQMGDYRVTDEQSKDFAYQLLELPQDVSISTRAKGRLNALRECIEVEQGAFGKNVLGLFNGATRYTTHKMKQKNRVFGNPFGATNQLNQKALTVCKQLVLDERARKKDFALA